MNTHELPQEMADRIKQIVSGEPNIVNGSPWLWAFPCIPSDIINNPILLDKTVGAAVMVSGAILLGLPQAIYSYDIVRKDRLCLDVDRHRLLPSGNTFLKFKEIDKTLPEHHTSVIPEHLLKKIQSD